jgi:hypothetical protein
VLFACGAEPEPTTPEGGGAQGELKPPEQPEEPILELSYQGGMIANPDPTSLVRVYAGGRVLVHYPAYMKNAGDYSLQLGEEELQVLLESFSNEGVLTLQESDLLLMAAETQPEMTEPQTDDHGVESVVRIRGESFTPEGAISPMMLNVDQTIRASGDLLRAAPDSSFNNLKRLATGIRGLEELARSESLEKIE